MAQGLRDGKGRPANMSMNETKESRTLLLHQMQISRKYKYGLVKKRIKKNINRILEQRKNRVIWLIYGFLFSLINYRRKEQL